MKSESHKNNVFIKSLQSKSPKTTLAPKKESVEDWKLIKQLKVKFGLNEKDSLISMGAPDLIKQ